MNEILTIYAIFITSLLVVYVDYNKCARKPKKEDEILINESSYSNESNENMFCSNKPIVVYGGSFHFQSKNDKSDRFKGRANTI